MDTGNEMVAAPQPLAAPLMISTTGQCVKIHAEIAAG